MNRLRETEKDNEQTERDRDEHRKIDRNKQTDIYIYIYSQETTEIDGWLYEFYGISTFVAYLRPNPFDTNNHFYFKQFSLA